jgi:predicted NAD/FAD-binding protein
MKVAVVGAGISGLSCAYRLCQAGADVTLYEAGRYFGGHSNTVDVSVDGHSFGVDTGFLVFNDRTYPQLIALFAELDVATAPSDMSFSVKLPTRGGGQLEWAGASLDTVFAQRGNLLRPRFLRMVADIVRFNREATALAEGGAMPQQGLGAWLDQQGYSAQFRHWYLLPMAACIWSCPSDQMLAFPLATFIRFCHNHGLLQVNDRPQWRTVRGGSRHYVDKLLAAIPSRRLQQPVTNISRASGGPAPVRVSTAAGHEYYDEVVLACHSDQALALLDDARPDEAALLGVIGYQPNQAVLHTDASCLPRRRKAWSAWNYQSTGEADGTPEVCVHYLLNMLQPLPVTTPVIVSLNPITPPDPSKVLATFDYAHPVFDAAAVAAQPRIARIQGVQNTWYAGAWLGYGFHEDGLKSGLAAASALIDKMGEVGVAALGTDDVPA